MRVWGLTWGLGLGVALAAHSAQPAVGEAWLAWWRSCPIADPSACIATREAQALADHGNAARRIGPQLQLRQDNTPSRWATLSTEASADSRSAYLGPLGDDGPHLLWVQTAGQPAQFKLVSRDGAPTITLDAPPVLSPDGYQLVVVASPLAQRPGSITLWQRAGARWAQKIRLEPGPDLTYSFNGWRSDGAAVRLRWQRVGAGCAPQAGRSQLRDGPFGWDLYPEAPPPCTAAPHSLSASASAGPG